MRHGFISVASATPKIKLADCEYNAERIMEYIDLAGKQEIKLIVFPELSVTGYTCGDLFLQDTLIKSAMEQVRRIAEHTKGKELLVAVGFPFCLNGKLYNTAALMQDGQILGLIPKINISRQLEYYEARYFTPGFSEPIKVDFLGEEVYFGSNILFQCKNMPQFIIAAEIGEDLWRPIPPSIGHCMAGATVIINLSAIDQIVGRDEYRRTLVKGHSAKLLCAYVYADAGEGESTTDLIFAGHNLIAENGAILKESDRFKNSIISTEIDLGRIISNRRKMYSDMEPSQDNHVLVTFALHEGLRDLPLLKLTREIKSSPFVPVDKSDREKRFREIINMQAMGLKTRLSHIGNYSAVIGVSGGLDSTLALLIISEAFKLLKADPKGIITVTMPSFGTTDRTYQNALILSKVLNTSLREIPISEAVSVHFKDIGHDPDKHDITYENCQARERTQVLMDIANMVNCIVVGTGNMSELALGWATYNGDHMSMYAVNASIPKTLVRHLVAYYADYTDNQQLREVLLDILDTPVSPELLPPKDGVISQKTEDIVGPYELHDFFLYYILRYGFEPDKIYRMALRAFEGNYDRETILKWMKVFYRRFFSQQFKRSCLPDGPKVGSVSVSPRGGLRMPSDASASLWLKELDI